MFFPNIIPFSNRIFSILRIIAFLLPLGAMLISASPSQAQKMYVKPTAEVPIRSGQGTEFKILSVVPDGLLVEIVEEDLPWVLVQTPGGTEGWMLKRYLSSAPPPATLVDNLKTQNAELVEKNTQLQNQLDELSVAHTLCSEELNTCIADRDETLRRYKDLQEDAADVQNIKNQLETALQETREARQELTAVRQANTDLKRTMALKWFLAGGGVLLVGWLLGLLFGRSKGKKSSLY